MKRAGVLFEAPAAMLVGIEATGSMHWFLNLMEELGIECRVGHPAQIRAAEPRKQKHDRRDADLILKLLAQNRFPTIWLPSEELLARGFRHDQDLLRDRSVKVLYGEASMLYFLAELNEFSNLGKGPATMKVPYAKKWQKETDKLRQIALDCDRGANRASHF